MDTTDTTPAESADYVDGPRFVKWLEDHGLTNTYEQLGSAIGRRISCWRHGGAASVWSADIALVRLGFHLRDLPDDIWIFDPGHLQSAA